VGEPASPQWHAAPSRISFGAQAMPQPPQLSARTFGSTHLPPQQRFGSAHAIPPQLQLPFVHVLPAEQVVPQAPQSASLVSAEQLPNAQHTD